MYTLTHLINALCFLGKSTQYTQKSSHIFLIGIRQINVYTFSIIHNNYTLYALKKFFNSLALIIMRFGYVWCWSTLKNSFAVRNTQLQSMCWVVPIKYAIPGLLTNFKFVIKSLNHSILEFIKYPQLVFYTNYTFYKKQILESLKTNILSSAILDSDSSLNSCMQFYWIPGNVSTKKTLLFYYFIFLQFLIQQKYLKLLFFLTKIFNLIFFKYNKIN